MLTNNEAGTIKAEHKTEIVEVFGKMGEVIANKLADNPQATMLELLFAELAKK